MLRASKRTQRTNTTTTTKSLTKPHSTTRKATKRRFTTAKPLPTRPNPLKKVHVRTFSAVPIGGQPELSQETLKHLTIDQYNQLRVQNQLPYGSDVIIQGWLRSTRNQGSVAFLTLNDGSNVHGVQTIVDPTWSQSSVYDLINNYSIPLGSAVRVKGKLARNERKPHESPEGWEVQVGELEIEGVCDTSGYLPKIPEKVQEPVSVSTDSTTGEAPSKKDKKQKKAAQEAAQLQKEQEELQLAKRVSQIPELEEYSLAPYPLQKKFQTLDFLRQHPDTRLRTNTYAAIQRVRSASMIALHNHFAQNDFVCIQPPILTPSDCEGGGEMFQVERTDKLGAATAEKHAIGGSDSATAPGTNKEDFFFHRPAFLSVSGQLYAEIAASSIRRVYSFGPTFRAENSHTSRHLAEFWMLEPEMSFATLDELCTACEASIQGAIQSLLKNPTTLQDLQFFEGRVDPTLTSRLRHVSSTPFGRITYTDAINLLNNDIGEKKIEFKVNELNWGDDLGTEHEKYLAEQVFQRPVFVTNYPAKIKPFYMKVDDDSLLASMPGIQDGVEEGVVLPRSKSISTDLATWSNYSKQSQIQSQQEYDTQNPLLKLPTLNRTTDAHSDDVTRMTVSCFDLLVPGMGELCGGSQREERLEVLLKRVNQYGLQIPEYQWYVDLRRFGTTKHGGWGMGFERFVAYVTGSENVRDTTLVPRAPGLMQI